MSVDDLGDRIKCYEDAFRHHLPIRMPVILRLDGKAFHTYTRGCERPFDLKLIDAMDSVALHLCKSTTTCSLAYVQSDEISLLLTPYRNIRSQPWFANNNQKMCSVSAALAASKMTVLSQNIFHTAREAAFDCRAFVVPREDVCNAFLWRQLDAIRNSVQMIARAHFSHKELNNKKHKEMIQMLLAKGVDVDSFPTGQRRGRCIVRKTKMIKAEDGTEVERSAWEVDREIPDFRSDRDYINKLVYFEGKE